MFFQAGSDFHNISQFHKHFFRFVPTCSDFPTVSDVIWGPIGPRALRAGPIGPYFPFAGCPILGLPGAYFLKWVLQEGTWGVACIRLGVAQQAWR